jgi:hypothetical protein
MGLLFLDLTKNSRFKLPLSLFFLF